MKKTAILFLFLFIVDNYSSNILRTIRTEIPPIIDGIIIDGEWNNCDSITQWIQLEPSKKAHSSMRTNIYSSYDQENLYFAFKCIMDPKKIIANISERDAIRKSDDAIFLLLDSFADGRSAYGFFVNPLGTLTDVKFVDDGRNSDYNWDTKWSAASSINSTGWEVEIAIPLNSISYKSELKEWGINFIIDCIVNKILKHKIRTEFII